MKYTFFILALALFIPLQANAALPAGCEVGYNFSILTGKPCVETQEKVDCLEGHKFSILTGRPCEDKTEELLTQVQTLTKKVEQLETKNTTSLVTAPVVQVKKANLDAVINNTVFQVSLEGFSDENTTMEITPPNGFEMYNVKKRCGVDTNNKKSCSIVQLFTKKPPMMFKDIHSGTYTFWVETMGQRFDFDLVKNKEGESESVNIDVY